jgi:hypothetical protein
MVFFTSTMGAHQRLSTTDDNDEAESFLLHPSHQAVHTRAWVTRVSLFFNGFTVATILVLLALASKSPRCQNELGPIYCKCVICDRKGIKSHFLAPAQNAISYTMELLHQSTITSPTKYQLYGPEVDAAWHELYSGLLISVLALN